MPAKEQGAPPRKMLSVRLTHPQWRRVRTFAVDLDTTVQDLLVAGLNRLFAEHSQEVLDPDSPLLPPTKKRKSRA
jgi:hypothetical protein